MLYYILPYIFLLLVTLYFYYNRQIKQIGFFHLFFALFPAFLIAILRGDVGTDTLNYLGFFEGKLINPEMGEQYEPGFELLGWIMSMTGMSPRFNVALVAVITTWILCKSFSRSKPEMMLFSLLIFPMYYWDFTMNGIRYGLSFSIVTIAIDALYRHKYLRFLILSIIAVSIQYSALLIVLVFLFPLVKKRYLVLIIGGFIGLLAVLPNAFEFFMTRLYDKQDAYKDLTAPSGLSGLAPLSFFLILYVVFIVYGKGKFFLLHILLIGEILSFIIARYTYAGLRLQGVFVFAIILFAKNNYKYIDRPNRYFRYIIVLNFLAFLIFIKNIVVIVPGDRAPFLPYKFYWEEKD
ncbi:EpsG family protein [Niabella insulamsoli]|uniref:EpsG family protein n=1 Tax=Niabella insulamsoli TaxID=3144874 RepID=UPI0031FCCF39